MANKKKTNKQIRDKIILIILIACLVGVAGFSAYQIISIMTEYHQSEEEYSNLVDNAVSVPDTSEETEEDDTIESQYLSVDHEYLRGVNSEYIGWINIPDTNINYPVVQHSNNQYYTSVSFEGKWSGGGAIFADYRNSDDWSDFHTVLYGHLLKNKTMFWYISQYQKQSYWDEHQTIEIYTDGQVEVYTVFSFFKTTSTSEVYTFTFEDDVAKLQYINMLVENSYYSSSVNVTVNDKILTLSTCTDATSENRWVLHAVLTDTYQLDD